MAVWYGEGEEEEEEEDIPRANFGVFEEGRRGENGKRKGNFVISLHWFGNRWLQSKITTILSFNCLMVTSLVLADFVDGVSSSFLGESHTDGGGGSVGNHLRKMKRVSYSRK